MNEEEKEDIELDIEAKYVDKTEKEFLSRVTYAECLYILTPKNKYCDKIKELSVLKICEIIEKLKKENEELKEINNQLEATKNEAIRRYNFETIPKQKIKDKIEELKKNPLKIKQNGKYYYETSAYNKIIISVLQELLEK